MVFLALFTSELSGSGGKFLSKSGSFSKLFLVVFLHVPGNSF